jgi:hypothetical protein
MQRRLICSCADGAPPTIVELSVQASAFDSPRRQVTRKDAAGDGFWEMLVSPINRLNPRFPDVPIEAQA